MDWWQEYRHQGELPGGRIAPAATVDLARPAFRMGLTELMVGIDASRLSVKVTPERKQYRVREKVKVSLDVRLPDGKTRPAPRWRWPRSTRPCSSCNPIAAGNCSKR